MLKRLNMLPKMQRSHFVKKYSVQFVNANGKLSAPFYFWDNKPHECSQTWQVVRSEFDQMMLDNAREHGVEAFDGVHVVDVLFEGERACGVLYALGGFNGGICLYLDDGHLAYEYNMLGMYRYKMRSPERIAAGRHAIEVEFRMSGGVAPQRPARAVLRVDGAEVAACEVGVTVTAVFSACETFDVGCDLGSPVAAEYFDRAPFAFDGCIHEVGLRYL